MSNEKGRTAALGACGRPAGAERTAPFGDGSAVFKVGGKMFALVSLDDAPGRITVKCEPDYAAALVREYSQVVPGYHMNKKHWVTVDLGPGPAAALVEELIENSYDLVVSGLPKSQRP